MSQIIDFLQSERQQFIPIVSEFMTEQKQLHSGLTPEFAEMLDFIEEYLLRGGKWHRPALCLLAYQIAGGNDLESARQAVVASEIIHRFLLVHDDIIDRDLYRHNGPTIEKAYQDRFKNIYVSKADVMYSKGMAIVAGDIIKTMGFALITQSKFSDAIKTAATKAITQLMMETGAGWQLQMEQNFKTITDVSEADFFKGMQLVSAKYSIVWPLRLGQIFAGRLSEDQWDENLDEYGWHTGAAFQIIDDILGMFGKPEETGKPVGHDYREGKKTFLILKAYANASDANKKLLDQTLGTEIDSPTLSQIQSIIKDTGSLEYSHQKALYHASMAKQALTAITSQAADSVKLLADLADFLAHREF